MSHIPKDLIKRLEYFHSEVETLFRRLFGAEMEGGVTYDHAEPCADILENDDEIIVALDLPGVDKQDIELHAGPNFLVIKGVKRPPASHGDCLRMERSFGAFQRMVPLPVTADTGKISANMNLGVLYVHLPKLKERRAVRKRIVIG